MKPSTIARYLVLIIAGLLASLSVGSLARLGQNSDMAGVYLFYTFTMLLTSLILLICYFQLKRRSKSVFWITLVILALGALLTIFDQIGFVDIVFLLLSVAAWITLYSSRKDYLPK